MICAPGFPRLCGSALISISLIADFLFLLDVDFETGKEDLSVEDGDFRFLSLDDVDFFDLSVDVAGWSDVVEDAVMERVTRISVRKSRENTTKNRFNQANVEMLCAGGLRILRIDVKCRRRKEGR